MRAAARQREDLHFVFVNTEPFDEHPRVHFLGPIVDGPSKTAYIDACDAMLHARAMGESFGLSIAEFSIRNKPIYTWFDGRDRHHIDVLRAKGHYYVDGCDLLAQLLAFDRTRQTGRDYDAYSERFSPERVMAAFASVFLGKKIASTSIA